MHLFNFIIILIFSLLVFSCNSLNTKTKEADTLSESKKLMQNEIEPSANLQEDTVHYEFMNKHSSEEDSLRIAYRDQVDTIYGFKKGKDILIVEGDIMMKLPRGGTRGVATTLDLWTKNRSGIVEIPYVINSNYPFPDRVKNAIRMWTEKSNIHFIDKKSFHKDYIEFVPSNNTQSYIGRIGGYQTIELAEWAREGNIAHEIGHSLGLYHEHSRADRDSFVNILCPREVNYRHAFKKDPYAIDFGDYNYYSIMHYPPTECLRIKKRDLPRGIPGQRDSLAASDYKTIKKIYKIQ